MKRLMYQCGGFTQEFFFPGVWIVSDASAVCGTTCIASGSTHLKGLRKVGVLHSSDKSHATGDICTCFLPKPGLLE